MEAAGPAQALGHVLDAAENASPLDAVEAVTRTLAATLHAGAAFFLIEDLSGKGLIRLSHAPGGHAETSYVARSGEEDARVRFDEAEQAVVLPFDGGPAEVAVRSQTVQVVPPAGCHEARPQRGPWVVLAPVTERGEVLGLLELTLPTEPDTAILDDIRRISHVLSFVIIANRRHTDLFEWGQRTTLFTLPAEVQRRLLPPAFTCEAGAFTLSAWLEPAASVGGDSFDYSLARDVLHLSLTDAMGHGVASALNATLCVGSLRNSRRSGASLLEQAGKANLAMCEHAFETGSEGFATGLLGRLDLKTGILTLVNAGHIFPYLCRSGRVSTVPLPADLPFGLFPEAEYRSTELQLEPGDRLLLLTDGMVERNAAAIDLPAAILATRGLHPRESTRHLTRSVVAVAAETGLVDDATVLVLDWYGSHGQERQTSMGSGLHLASGRQGGRIDSGPLHEVDRPADARRRRSRAGAQARRYGQPMTEPANESRVERRALDLLPEEEAAGSDNPQEQAAAILAESDARIEHPEETRRESSQTPDEEDTAPAVPADPATGRPTDAGTGTTPQ